MFLPESEVSSSSSSLVRPRRRVTWDCHFVLPLQSFNIIIIIIAVFWIDLDRQLERNERTKDDVREETERSIRE